MTSEMTRDRFEDEARRLRPTLLRVAASITGNADDAADVAQETLLKLWYMRERLHSYSSIDAIARVIARNLSINVLRRQHPAESAELRLADSIADDSTDEELSEELSKALAGLPGTEQIVLRMKHLDGMEVEEIAAVIQSTPGAVRTALCRARRRIRQLYISKL